MAGLSWLMIDFAACACASAQPECHMAAGLCSSLRAGGGGAGSNFWHQRLSCVNFFHGCANSADKRDLLMSMLACQLNSRRAPRGWGTWCAVPPPPNSSAPPSLVRLHMKVVIIRAALSPAALRGCDCNELLSAAYSHP
jgi:hypothetical protein